MTQMHAPYEDPSDVMLYQEPERTSVMAILSMVFGFGGCCLGLTSIPAIFLGIFSLIGISKSKGRVGGTGFSITGILVGLLTLALWGGIGGAMVYGVRALFVPMGEHTERFFLDLQAENFDSARDGLVLSEDLSDEEMMAFREQYRSTLGDLVSAPVGLREWIGGFSAIAQQSQGYQGHRDIFPMPMRFDSGWALVVYVMEPNPSGVPLPTGFIVIDQRGNAYHLPPALADEDFGMPGGTDGAEASEADSADSGMPDDEPEAVDDGP